MGRLCPICGKSVQHVWSHLSRVHKINGQQRTLLLRQENKQEAIQEPVANTHMESTETEKCTRFQLIHPFTAIVAGMTGSGKTVWVQNLLEHATQVISPPPQRIIWSYSQWQPAYDHMLATIPGIEFVKGIPHDIDEDDFFDPRINNMIVIDDQMTETSNDKRIMDLFTKGSHHRNLSVAFLSQNLYFQGKIMRTVSLNAGYLVLFKNPRDKLQIMTLGKQMYPGKTEQFIQKYEAAVQRPYGYLFVDLKPNTPEECRLRTNVLPNDQTVFQAAPTISQYGGQSVMDPMTDFFQRQSYLQPPLLKTLQNLEEKMSDILRDPSAPAELKIKEYSQLYNRYLELQQQLQMSGTLPVHMSRPELLQSPQIPNLASLSAPTTMATPENIPPTSIASDSGYATPKTKLPSFIERLTSKIRTPSFDLGGAKTSISPAVASTPLKPDTRFEQPSQPTTSFSTPRTQGRPTPLDSLPTPPASKEKPVKWISYQDVHKYDRVLEPPRRSERLRAIAKSLPNWEKY